MLYSYFYENFCNLKINMILYINSYLEFPNHVRLIIGIFLVILKSLNFPASLCSL